MGLEEYSGELYHCFHCHLCTLSNWHRLDKWMPICPSFEYFGFESYAASGRIEIVRAIIEEEMEEFTPNLPQIIFSCTGCGACHEQCNGLTGFRAEHVDLFRDLKARSIEKGEILPEHMGMIEGMKKEDNPFGEPKEKRGEWAEDLDIKNINEEEAKVVFHAGCRFSYDKDLQEIARKAAKLLVKAGVDLGIGGKEESCCGGRAFDTGHKGEMAKYAEDVKSRLKASGAEVVVTPCADCYDTFKRYYPSIGKELDIEVLHITEHLVQLIGEGKIEPKAETPMKVTYHDPCHLGRHMGVYEPPRRVLQNIPGIELVEMPRNRENAWCSGSGGGVLEAYSDFAHWSAMERIEEAKNSGAEALVTACPWCERNFKDALKENGRGDFKIFDIVELLSRSVKEK